MLRRYTLTKYIDEQIKREIPEAKSLRWLAINFPKIENPKDDIERMQNCIHTYCVNGADLINRQEAEIERLKRILDSYALQYGTAVDKDRFLRQAKSEAIKEFAERLKLNGYWDIDLPDYVFVDDIDNLVKEMVGEGE